MLSQSFGQLVGNIKTYIGELNELNDQLKEDNLTLEAATLRDSLTGVRNRFALRRDYNFYGEQHIHLMMLDIDDFKGVNDNFGHSVGDYLLKKTGDALIDIFGSEYSYRYGGDEFTVILPDYAEEDFQSAVEVLKDRLESIRLEDKKLPVHFSAGYVYGRTDLGDDLRLMLRQADELLYKSKGSGKSTFKGEPYDREYAADNSGTAAHISDLAVGVALFIIVQVVWSVDEGEVGEKSLCRYAAGQLEEVVVAVLFASFSASK